MSAFDKWFSTSGFGPEQLEAARQAWDQALLDAAQPCLSKDQPENGSLAAHLIHSKISNLHSWNQPQ